MALAARYTSRDSRCFKVDATNFESFEINGMTDTLLTLLELAPDVFDFTVAFATVLNKADFFLVEAM